MIDTNIIQISTFNMDVKESEINSEGKEKETTYFNNMKIFSTQNNYNLEETWKKSDDYEIDSTNIICNIYCKKCDGIIELNENNDIINQNCLECIDGYHFKYDTKNCYNDSILEKGFYLSSEDSKYHE